MLTPSPHQLLVRDPRPKQPDVAPGDQAKSLLPSRHVVDLTGRIEMPVEAPKPANPYRGHGGHLRRMLDESLGGARDLSARSVSVRERGWRDFPPTKAGNIFEAIAITAERFFERHPLAELTVVSVVFLAVFAVVRLVVPMRPEPAAEPSEAIGVADHAAPVKPLAAMPIMAVMPMPQAAAHAAETSSEAAPAPRWRRVSYDWRLGTVGGVLGFAMTCAVVILPIGAYGQLGPQSASTRTLMETGVQAAASLSSAIDATAELDFSMANTHFLSAQTDFEAVAGGLGNLGRAVSYAAGLLPVNSRLAAVAPLVSVGRDLSAGGAVMTAALDRLSDNPDFTNTKKLGHLADGLRAALPHFERANGTLSEVSPDSVPDAYRGQIVSAKERLPVAVDMMRQAIPALDLLNPLLGADEPKRYLVVFQNNAELRPTGGFIGSYALVDLREGEIVRLEIPGGGSYSIQGQQTLKVSAPQPLRLINPHWEFQDSNWYPDFPTSAQLITRFYERGGGPTPHGVVAVNASVMERLLDAVGPIEMPEYGKTITSRNFFYETQKAVELEYDIEENAPKQFLADLAPKLLERLESADLDVAQVVGGALLEALAAKEIQLYVGDETMERQITELGWGGEVKPTDGDYLYVVHTNIAGQKTDVMMRDKLSRFAKILPDGSVIVTLDLERTHRGEKNALFTGVRNVDFVRFYVPSGAELIAATGFKAPDPRLFKIADEAYGEEETLSAEEAAARFDRESGTRISEDAGKTVFGNWIMTDPGETSRVKLIYQLPAGTAKVSAPESDSLASRLKDAWRGPAPARLDYAVTVQKQPGANPSEVTNSVELPVGWHVTENEPNGRTTENWRFVSSADLSRDTVFRLSAESMNQ
jgi:hypothetical protein